MLHFLSTSRIIFIALLVGFLVSADATSWGQTGQEEKFAKIRELGMKSVKAFESGDYPTAVTAIEKMTKLDPANLSYLLKLGDACFFAADMKKCIDTYDRAVKMDRRLGPQLWQRGLALYYARRFKDGVKQFETHQKVNSQDVENAVWHLLCNAQVKGLEAARKDLINITGDTRVPMKQVFQMFAGKLKPAEVIKAAEESDAVAGSGAQRMGLYHAHLYVGLYYDLIEKPIEAAASMKAAQKICPLPADNFMGQVAQVHLMCRAREKKAKKKAKR